MQIGKALLRKNARARAAVSAGWGRCVVRAEWRPGASMGPGGCNDIIYHRIVLEHQMHTLLHPAPPLPGDAAALTPNGANASALSGVRFHADYGVAAPALRPLPGAAPSRPVPRNAMCAMVVRFSGSFGAETLGHLHGHHFAARRGHALCETRWSPQSPCDPVISFTRPRNSSDAVNRRGLEVVHMQRPGDEAKRWQRVHLTAL
jgi:hypothetical protein